MEPLFGVDSKSHTISYCTCTCKLYFLFAFQKTIKQTNPLNIENERSSFILVTVIKTVLISGQNIAVHFLQTVHGKFLGSKYRWCLGSKCSFQLCSFLPFESKKVIRNKKKKMNNSKRQRYLLLLILNDILVLHFALFKNPNCFCELVTMICLLFSFVKKDKSDVHFHIRKKIKSKQNQTNKYDGLRWVEQKWWQKPNTLFFLSNKKTERICTHDSNKQLK